MKLEHISDNLVILLQEVVKDQKIVKYIHYDKNNPLSQPDLALPANNLIRTKVLPYPFEINTQLEDGTELRIYYPKGDLNNEVVENIDIYFDIITSKKLWLINDNDKSQIRPYEIMKLLKNYFSNKSISTLGKLKFKRFVHVSVNEKFDCIRLIAEMMMIK